MTKLADSSLLTGSPMLFLVFGILGVVLSVVFFLGKGKNLIAGFNTASKEEQAQYDEKKLNLVMAFGMLFIGIICLLMFFLINVLPEWTIWIFVAFVLIDATLMCVFANTLCKKDLQKNKIQQ